MMSKSLRNNILTLIVLALVITFSYTTPQIFSQSIYNDYISLKLPENPGSIFDLLFNYPIINHGTLIDKSTSKEVFKEKTSRRKLAEDTTGNRENRITKIIYNARGDEIQIELELAERDQKIQISAYNLLGKIVLEPLYTSQNSSVDRHTLNVSRIPNGVYLCVVVGKNFRLREKFIISR